MTVTTSHRLSSSPPAPSTGILTTRQPACASASAGASWLPAGSSTSTIVRPDAGEPSGCEGGAMGGLAVMCEAQRLAIMNRAPCRACAQMH